MEFVGIAGILIIQKVALVVMEFVKVRKNGCLTLAVNTMELMVLDYKRR